MAALTAEAHPIDRILEVVTGHEGGGLSVRAIARKAGLSPGTVTYYFASRSALMDAALERYHSVISDLVEGWMRKKGKARAGVLVEQLVGHLFHSRSDVRRRIGTWVESWSLPQRRQRQMEHLLDITTREPWGAGWSEQDRRVIVQCLTWGAQHFAALEDEDLVALVRASGRVEAQAAVSDALARLADALAGGALAAPAEGTA
tara:strand:+ start:823 stop:1431 length:609 start_codon:yes stop_codon:yes gene_type:complete